MSVVRQHLLDRRLARASRWIACSPQRAKSVAEHSYYVARTARRICHLLKVRGVRVNRKKLKIDVLKVVDMALMHDEPEAVTGDVPLPVESVSQDFKKESERILREEYAGIPQGDYFIDLWCECNRPVSDDSLERQIVSVADAIAGYAECIEELDLGNRNFQEYNNRYAMLIGQFDYDWFEPIRDELGFKGISKRRRRHN